MVMLEQPRRRRVHRPAPLPDHIDDQAVLEAVHLDKDVDGHPVNAGKWRWIRLLFGSTPKGILSLLDRAGLTPR